MNITAGQYSTLYLHGGPGMSALAERQRLAALTDVYWWDQPRPLVGDSAPLQSLLKASADELTRLAVACNGKIRLLACSVGAQIACHLARHLPHYISGITLLSPGYDLRITFMRLAKKLAEKNASDTELLSAVAALSQFPENREFFWQLISTILKTPDFSDVYWSPGAVEQREWFAALLTNPAVFDFNAFYALTNDYLNEPSTIKDTGYRGPVSIVFGLQDPLSDMALDMRIWKEYFPQATARNLNAGHFLQFELPASDWNDCL